MFETKTITSQTKPIAGQHNFAARQSSNKSHNQTTSQTELAKTKCAGGVCSVDWRPIPTFYRSSQS